MSEGIEILILPGHWLQVSNQTRQLLAKQFNIKRSGGPVVTTRNGVTTVETDGYSVKDLKAMSVIDMQEYLNSKETDILKLFAKCVKKIEPPPPPKEDILK